MQPHLRPPFPAALALLLPLSACVAVGRDHEPPELAVPSAWREEPAAGLADGEADLAAWWRGFGDPTLAALVERALRDGHDLRAALARLAEARALRGVAEADLYPTLDATAGFERTGESANTPLGAFVPDSDVWSAGLEASWEVDLWGRVRRAVEAAEADLEAAALDAHAVAVSVAAETAAAYVDLRAFQARLAIARTNVSLQEQTLALVQARFDAGLVGERDVAQAATNVASTRSRVPGLEAAARAAENRLAVLVGAAPGSLAAELEAVRPIPRPPETIAVGVPADLLRRRPDVRRAERVLAAEVARIGVAEGDLYPRLVLLGRIGVAADTGADLLQHESGFFAFGPSLRWNLFDAGRLRNLVRAQDARAEQAAIAWERTVLGALEEAENALTAVVREDLRRAALTDAAAQARRAAELAQTQYEEGLTDFQAVLDSERALALLEDELAASDAAATASVIALYRALGGGFEPAPEAIAAAG